MRFALGLAWRTDGTGKGPQATFAYGPLFVRGLYLSGGDWALLIGVALGSSLTVLTASPEDVAACFASGMDGCLTKPISMARMVDALECCRPLQPAEGS